MRSPPHEVRSPSAREGCGEVKNGLFERKTLSRPFGHILKINFVLYPSKEPETGPLVEGILSL